MFAARSVPALSPVPALFLRAGLSQAFTFEAYLQFKITSITGFDLWEEKNAKKCIMGDRETKVRIVMEAIKVMNPIVMVVLGLLSRWKHDGNCYFSLGQILKRSMCF